MQIAAPGSMYKYDSQVSTDFGPHCVHFSHKITLKPQFLDVSLNQSQHKGIQRCFSPPRF